MLIDSGNNDFQRRILIGTPTTGLVRIEWVSGRYGNLVPPNWSMVNYMQYIDSFVPVRYTVDDAQNLIVKQAVENDFEWLLLVEHDVIIPEDTFVRMDQYMRDSKYPVVSGLYFTRTHPSLPLIYRKRGSGTFTDWKMGDMVWADGVPTGILLINVPILKHMWEDSPEYQIHGTTTRKVFRTPMDIAMSPEEGMFKVTSGTSDLEWCTRVMEGEYFAKAGWDEFQEKEYPFLVDTNIFCRHIDPDGRQFPINWQELMKYRKPLSDYNSIEPHIPDSPPDLGVNVGDNIGVDTKIG